jgi:membrane-associated phospholipid phosphatase
MIPFNQPLLINILGHAAGALIFASFLFLLFSERGWYENRHYPPDREQPLPCPAPCVRRTNTPGCLWRR